MTEVELVAFVSLFLAGCFGLAFLYPYLLYPLILSLFSRRPFGPDHPPERDELPSAALLFCAYNEEASLPGKIKNLREIKKFFPRLDIYAYTDCCTDRSVELLSAASDILTLHEGTERAGKATGMRRLVAGTSAEVLIFTDANVLLEPASAVRLVEKFLDPEVGTVAGTLHYTNPDAGVTARVGSLYWRLEEVIKRMESTTGSTMGADGSIFATRRGLYPDVPPNLLDDMISSITPIFHGLRVVTAGDVHAFEKSTTGSADEFRRKRRIACRAFNTHRYLAPRLKGMSLMNRFKYFSHKYMRWFSAAFLVCAAVLGAVGLSLLWGMTSALLILALISLMLAIGHKIRPPLLGSATEILISIVAVGIGIFESVRGQQYQTWEPAKSRN